MARGKYDLWTMRLGILGRSVQHDFPPDDEYLMSLWADWCSRIRKGHQEEVERLKKLADEWNDGQYDFGDWYAEDIYNAERLNNVMHASMVVALWGNVENLLKSTLSACNAALRTKKTAATTLRQFCDDVLDGNPTQTTHQDCIRLLKSAFSKPFAIDDLRTALKKVTGVDSTTCCEQATVDAIRVLNNSFKHSNGRYLPDRTKPHTEIDSALLAAWNVIGPENRIEFQRLPFKELVGSCNKFFVDLHSKLEPAIAQKLAANPGNV